jgi:hypothetical protein
MLMRAWLLASVGMGGLKFVRNCVLSCRKIHSENLAPVLIHHGAYPRLRIIASALHSSAEAMTDHISQDHKPPCDRLQACTVLCQSERNAW